MPDAKADMPISTLVVDDEELARSLLRTLIRRDADLLLVGEFADGAAAIEAIREKKPDLVFLDIQMPVLDGIAVAEKLAALEHVPYVIFVTAYDDYAIRAFELNALDYLVKPLQKARFRTTVERAKLAIRNREMLRLTERLLQLGAARSGTSAPPRGEQEITVRSGDRIVQLTTSDISWIEAANQYVHIHANGKTFTVSESLSRYAKRIHDPRFFRVHRSALVNGSAIDRVSKQRNGTHRIRLRDGAELTVARSRASMIPDLLRVARQAASGV